MTNEKINFPPSTKTICSIPESFLSACGAWRHKKKEPHRRRRRLQLASAAKAPLVVGRGNLQRDRPDYGSEMRRARLATGIPPSFCLPRRLNKAWATSLGGWKDLSVCYWALGENEMDLAGKQAGAGPPERLNISVSGDWGEQIHTTPPCCYKEGAKQSCKSKWTLPLPAQSLLTFFFLLFFSLFCPCIYSLMLIFIQGVYFSQLTPVIAIFNVVFWLQMNPQTHTDAKTSNPIFTLVDRKIWIHRFFMDTKQNDVTVACVYTHQPVTEIELEEITVLPPVSKTNVALSAHSRLVPDLSPSHFIFFKFFQFFMYLSCI